MTGRLPGDEVTGGLVCSSSSLDSVAGATCQVVGFKI